MSQADASDTADGNAVEYLPRNAPRVTPTAASAI
jgi:hypothetical protein